MAALQKLYEINIGPGIRRGFLYGGKAMYIKIENHAENSVKIIDYPGDMKTFLWAHSFGVFNIAKIKTGTYQFIDRFSGDVFQTVSKPGKREIAAYEKGAARNA